MELSAEWPSTTLWRPALLNDLSASISEYLVDNHVAFWTLTPSESRTLGPKAPSGVLMRGASVGGLAGSPPQDDGAHLQVLLSAPGGSSETRTQVLPVVLFAHPYCDGALDGRADWTFPQTPVGSGGGADIGHISLDPLYSGVTCTMRTRWTARRSCLHGLGLCTGEGILDADGRKPRVHLSQRFVFGRLCFARASPRLVLSSFTRTFPPMASALHTDMDAVIRDPLPALVDPWGSTPSRRGGWTRAACGPIILGGEPTDHLCCEDM
ncbi:hypothetical protein B0H14DRAFT_3429873 [Mycena olivaceomarginata]|nr:hypothetical protein B0H14DRAFT_3429873 [Mycena olivaceomarginata]